MPTDLLAARQPHLRPMPSRQHDRIAPTSSRNRGWIFAASVGTVILIASVVAVMFRGARSSSELGPRLTHTIKRGDLAVTVLENGILESAENVEVKCKVRGQSTVIWVIEGGTIVKPGDVLVRLDTLRIENAFNERSKYAFWSRSSAERARANLARATLAISEYSDGRYRAQLLTLEKELAVAESDLRTARSMVSHAKMLADRGYVSDLEVEQRAFAVRQAELNVELKETEIEVLKDFTKEIRVQTLKGNFDAAKANLAAAEERAKMDAARRDLAAAELKRCVIKAEQGGLVIHPSSAKWLVGPEIEEGSTVHKDQVLMLMPDLSRMQVKMGVRESVVEHVKPGQIARVTLPDMTLEGEVASVAVVTLPASWWTGNVVKYDTIIELPSGAGLHPGMSAEVEIVLARHENVLMIPVAAVVDRESGECGCWVRTTDGLKRRTIKLGDTNGSFSVVQAGLQEGDQVILNPSAVGAESKTIKAGPMVGKKKE